MWAHRLWVVWCLVMTGRLSVYGWASDDVHYNGTAQHQIYNDIDSYERSSDQKPVDPYSHESSSYQIPIDTYVYETSSVQVISDTYPFDKTLSDHKLDNISLETLAYARNNSTLFNEMMQYDSQNEKLPHPVIMSIIASNWVLFYVNYCGSLCDNGTLIRTHREACPYPYCFPCDCHANCISRGTCCPSLHDIENNGTQDWLKIYGKNNSTSDVLRRAVCDNAVLTVSSCPRRWNDQITRQNCENPTGDSLDSVIPYNDIITGLTFRNIHCVICNGLKPHTDSTGQMYTNLEMSRTVELSRNNTLQAMEFEVTCSDYGMLSHITDRVEFYRVANSLSECQIGFKDSSNTIKCPSFNIRRTLEEGYIASCPTNSSETLKDLCLNLPDVPAMWVFGAKNIFCSICSGILVLQSEGCGSNSSDMTAPTTMLFSPSPGRADEDTSDKLEVVCGLNQLGHLKEWCLHVSCAAGKVAVDPNTCETKNKEIRGLFYLFKVTFISDRQVPGHLQHLFIASLNNVLSSRISFRKFTYSANIRSCRLEQNHVQHEMETELRGYIYAPKFVSRDEFENQTFHALFINPCGVVIHDEKENILYNVSLHTVCVGREMCDIYRQHSKHNNCPVFKTNVENGDYDLPLKIPQQLPEMLPTLTCPYVTLDLTEKPRIFGKTAWVTLDLKSQKNHLAWDTSSMSYEKGKVNMCVQMYRNIHILLEKGDSTSYTLIVLSMVHYYLDTVCIFVSCALLLISILTYLLFPSLRSLPGLNTMCLCLCLFTAQLSLLITSLFGTRGLLSENYCVVHGIVLHYSWVASFVWMNTCCIHTYRVFTGIKIQYRFRNFTWYCVYSFGLPVLVVALVILTTTLTTRGKSIGYDSRICFLDTTTSSLILIMGLLAPLLFSVISNLVLFTLTIRTIVSMTRMRQQPKSNHGVVTYVKLSVFTGFFCLLTATAIQFNNPVLSLVASPFAALQGVFIFVSFIATKRVFKLYADSISNKTRAFTSSQNDASSKTTPI